MHYNMYNIINCHFHNLLLKFTGLTITVVLILLCAITRNLSTIKLDNVVQSPALRQVLDNFEIVFSYGRSVIILVKRLIDRPTYFNLILLQQKTCFEPDIFYLFMKSDKLNAGHCKYFL